MMLALSFPCLWARLSPGPRRRSGCASVLRPCCGQRCGHGPGTRRRGHFASTHCPRGARGSWLVAMRSACTASRGMCAAASAPMRNAPTLKIWPTRSGRAYVLRSVAGLCSTRVISAMENEQSPNKHPQAATAMPPVAARQSPTKLSSFSHGRILPSIPSPSWQSNYRSWLRRIVTGNTCLDG